MRQHVPMILRSTRSNNSNTNSKCSNTKCRCNSINSKCRWSNTASSSSFSNRPCVAKGGSMATNIKILTCNKPCTASMASQVCMDHRPRRRCHSHVSAAALVLAREGQVAQGQMVISVQLHPRNHRQKVVRWDTGSLSLVVCVSQTGNAHRWIS